MEPTGYRNFDLQIGRTSDEKAADGSSEYRIEIRYAANNSTVIRKCRLPPDVQCLLVDAGRSTRKWRRDTTQIGSEALAVNAADLPTLKDIGKILFEALFPDTVAGEFKATLLTALQDDQHIRVRIDLTEAPELSRVPWEALYWKDRDDLLAASQYVNLVRTLRPPLSARPPPPLDRTVRLLIAEAVPRGDLDSNREILNIEERLKPLLRRDGRTAFEIDVLRNANRRTLPDRVAEFRPDIFHFIGHGGFDGGTGHIVLNREEDPRRGEPLDSEWLRNALAKPQPRLVFLNSCQGAQADTIDPFGGVAQNLIRWDMPFVIAMQFPVSDEAAVRFSEIFYRAIAWGSSVDAAVTDGRRAIQLLGEELNVEMITPVLYTSGRQEHLLAPVSASAGASAAASPLPTRTAEASARMASPAATGTLLGLLFRRNWSAPSRWIRTIVLVGLGAIIVGYAVDELTEFERRKLISPDKMSPAPAKTLPVDSGNATVVVRRSNRTRVHPDTQSSRIDVGSEGNPGRDPGRGPASVDGGPGEGNGDGDVAVDPQTRDIVYRAGERIFAADISDIARDYRDSGGLAEIRIVRQSGDEVGGTVSRDLLRRLSEAGVPVAAIRLLEEFRPRGITPFGLPVEISIALAPQDPSLLPGQHIIPYVPSSTPSAWEIRGTGSEALRQWAQFAAQPAAEGLVLLVIERRDPALEPKPADLDSDLALAGQFRSNTAEALMRLGAPADRIRPETEYWSLDPEDPETRRRLLSVEIAPAVKGAEQIGFDSRSSILSDDEEAKLDRVTAWLEGRPGLDVLLRPHADDFPTEEENRRLANVRAACTAESLIRRGVAPNRIRTEEDAVYIQSRPAASEGQDPVPNRRVELILRPPVPAEAGGAPASANASAPGAAACGSAIPFDAQPTGAANPAPQQNPATAFEPAAPPPPARAGWR